MHHLGDSILIGQDLMKRRNLVQPVFTIDTIDEVMQIEIEKHFPVGVDIDEKAISSISSRFSFLKSECRNFFLPHYLKETKVKKSGEYNDDDIIMNIFESSIKARIDARIYANCYKAKRTMVAELKAKKANFSLYDFFICSFLRF